MYCFLRTFFFRRDFGRKKISSNVVIHSPHPELGLPPTVVKSKVTPNPEKLVSINFRVQTYCIFYLLQFMIRLL